MYKLIIFLCIFVISCQAATLNNQVVPVFHKYKELNTQFLESIKSNNTDQWMKRKKVEEYMYKDYTKALNILENSYCSKPDEQALDEFISVLISTKNSAYELPSFILGKMYICQPKSIIDKINHLDPTNKKYIVNTLEWGFKNVTFGENIKNYTELVYDLNKLKGRTN